MRQDLNGRVPRSERCGGADDVADEEDDYAEADLPLARLVQVQSTCLRDKSSSTR